MDIILDRLHSLGLATDAIPAIRLGFALVLGAALAVYLRFLYNRFSTAISNNESISRSFPLLVLATITVIAVVKGSLALSLGLVGALSIVRFRAAIKDPEELVYLFICIAVGIALGAGHLPFAVVLVAVASVYLIARHRFGGGPNRESLLLTLEGDARDHFDDPEQGALAVVRRYAPSLSIQRYDVEDERGRMRLVAQRLTTDETSRLISELRRALPSCQVSYVNLSHIL